MWHFKCNGFKWRSFFEYPQEILPDIKYDLYEDSNKNDESSSQSSDSYNTEDEINN